MQQQNNIITNLSPESVQILSPGSLLTNEVILQAGEASFQKQSVNFIMSIDSISSSQTPSEKIIGETVFEKKLMRLTLSILINFQQPQFSYIIILFIETLQIASITIKTGFFGKWDGVEYFYIREAFSVISLQKFAQYSGNDHTAVLISSVCLLAATIVLSIVLSCYASEANNFSQGEKICANILGFILVLLKTVFQIPFMYLVIYSFISDFSNRNLTIALTIVLIVLLIPCLLYIILCFNVLNPFAETVLAGQSYHKKSLSFLSKFTIVLFSVLDKDHSNQLVLLIMVMAGNLTLTTINYWFTIEQHNLMVRKYRQWERLLQFWLAFFVVVSSYTTRLNNLYTYFFMVAVCSIALVQFMCSFSHRRTLTQNFIQLENTRRIQKHALQLMHLIDSIHNRQSRILLQGYLSFHSRRCNLPSSTCNCKQVINHSTCQLQGLKIVYYQFLAYLLKGSLIRVQDKKRIYMLLSFIYQYRLNNKFQAVHSLIRSMGDSSTVMDRLEYMSQMKLIEYEITEDQLKKNVILSVDMLRFLKFNLKIVQFEKTLETCANSHVDFWNELLETNLNINKLEKFGAVIAKQRQKVKDFYLKIQQLNCNNAHIMILYGQFLSWVCNEDYQNIKLLQKGETILKNLRESSKISGKNQKYSDNSHAAIIIISGNEKQLGKVIQTNNFVHEYISYHRKQLISLNISAIMPKVYAQTHDAVLQRFLSTSKDRYNGIERLVPVLCKDGYILPSLALTKPLPHLQEGIQIVGYLSEYQPPQQDDIQQKIAYILYNRETEIIMGISKICFTQYGIPRCLVYGDASNSVNQMKLKHLFGVSLQKNDGGFDSNTEIIANINVQNVRDEFVITHTAETMKVIDENPDFKVGSCEVVVRSLLEQTYSGIPLRIISVSRDSSRSEHAGEPSRKMKNSKFQLKQEKQQTRSETDQLKDLKDFKNFISIKREPSAIRFLKWACFTLIIIYLTGIAGLIVLHVRQFGVVSITMEGINLAFLSRMYVAELSFQIDKMLINNSQKYGLGQVYNEEAVVVKMNQLIETAKKNELKLLPLKNQFQIPAIPSIQFDFYPNGSYSTLTQSSDQTLSTQLIRLSQVANSEPSYLTPWPLDPQSLTASNFLSTRHTQLFSLSQACNTVQLSIYEQGFHNYYQLRLIIIIVCSILVVLALVWLLVSLPRTLQVTYINQKVLSLFRLISRHDVKEVIKKCYVYQRKFLIEASVDQKKIDELSRNQVHQGTENDMEGPSGRRPSKFGLLSANSPFSSPGGSLNASFADTSARNFADTSARNLAPELPSKPKQKYQFNLQMLDMQGDQKILNKGNTDKTKAIVTFLLIFIFLAGYCGSVIVYLITNYNTIYNEINIMNLMYNRTAQFQQIKTTYLKYLQEPGLAAYGGNITGINLALVAKIYETERELVEAVGGSGYRQAISEYNTRDLCAVLAAYQGYRLWGPEQLSEAQCRAVENGILTRGIKTTFVTIMQQIRSTLSVPQPAALPIPTLLKYSQLQPHLIRPLLMLASSLQLTLTASQSSINLVFYLVNTLFISCIVVFWGVVWRRYLHQLNESVWRTKSMLNIIPTKIITNSEVLMGEFTSGQLERVVR